MSAHATAATWLDLAVAASNAGQHADAEAAFRQALAIDPDLGEARLGLGLTLMATRRLDEAVASLRLATASGDAPALWETCLAQALYMTGDFAGSAEAFERVARREPLGLNARLTHARAQSFAALIEGTPEAAFDQYLALAGEEAEPIARLAEEASSILGVFGYRRAALAVGRWRLARNPEDETLAYLVRALEGERLERAPAAYVESHFDAFADRFDRQLVDGLNYRAPEQLAALLAAHETGFETILDLGCGTGLSAEPLARFGASLVGVDLSRAMLEHAAARGAYAQLVHEDAVTFLGRCRASFDLVFAADVLVYFGDLTEMFANVATALKPGGYFAFSSEIGAGDWTLLTSGRFAHADAYIRDVAGSTFEVLDQVQIPLRQEGARIVQGALHVLRRA